MPDLLQLGYDPAMGELHWLYENASDGNLDGEVGIADLVPIAVYFKRVVDSDGRLAWVDYDGNGMITLGDVIGVACNFGRRVTGYRVLAAEHLDPLDPAFGYRELACLHPGNWVPGWPPRFSLILPQRERWRFVKLESAPVDYLSWPYKTSLDLEDLDGTAHQERGYTDPGTGDSYQIVDGIVVLRLRATFADARVKAFLRAEGLEAYSLDANSAMSCAFKAYLPKGQSVKDAVLALPQEYPDLIMQVAPLPAEPHGAQPL